MPIEHTYRIAGKEFTEVLSFRKAIVRHCTDCCAGVRYEVAKCHIETCPLFPFRNGKDPGLKKRIYTEDEKAVMRQHLNSIRKPKNDG